MVNRSSCECVHLEHDSYLIFASYFAINRCFVVHCATTSLLFSVSYQTAHIIWSSSLPIKNIGSTRTGVPYDPKFLTSNLNSFRMTIQCITLPIILYKISRPFSFFTLSLVLSLKSMILIKVGMKI